MDIPISPAAETLIQQLLELGYDNPETIVEQALKYFYNQQLIDTSLGFPDLSEAEIVQQNETCWQTFQQNPNSGIPQADVAARFLNDNL